LMVKISFGNLMVKISGFKIMQGGDSFTQGGDSFCGQKTDIVPGTVRVGLPGVRFPARKPTRRNPHDKEAVLGKQVALAISVALSKTPAGDDRGSGSVLTGRKMIIQTRATCPAGRPASRALLLAALLACLVAESCGKLKQQHTTHRLQLHVSPCTF